MSLFFECAGISYNLLGQIPHYITEDVIHYFSEEQKPENRVINCSIKCVTELEPVKGIPVYQNKFRLILDDGGKECRIHFFDGIPVSYYREISDSEIEIQFTSQLDPIVNMPFLEHFALEKHLLKTSGIVMHACAIKYNNEAIIFSAPSGTGKSTQGNLWVKYKCAEIINGDKCIVQNRNGKIFACGLPFCGSSTENKNEELPLKAIVILSQGRINKIEPLNTADSVKKIMSETSINYWNSKFLDQSIVLITDIANAVPVIHLECTPTINAVNILSQFLNL